MTHSIKKSFTESAQGLEFKISSAKWTDAFVNELISQGIRIKLQRAASGKTENERQESAQAIAAQLNEGVMPSGGGGRTSDPITAEAKAMLITALKAAGLDTKTAREQAKTIWESEEAAHEELRANLREQAKPIVKAKAAVSAAITVSPIAEEPAEE